jgi:hypothetical protein
MAMTCGFPLSMAFRSTLAAIDFDTCCDIQDGTFALSHPLKRMHEQLRA